MLGRKCIVHFNTKGGSQRFVNFDFILGQARIR